MLFFTDGLLGWIGNKRPRMVVVQAAGCAPIVRAFQKGERFEYPAAYSPATLAEGAFGLIGGEPVRVRVRFAATVGRFVRLPEDPATAEAAITVADNMQHKGVGRQLSLLLADEARELGIRRFSASILADNEPALRLMRTMTRRLEAHSDHGVNDLVAHLAA